VSTAYSVISRMTRQGFPAANTPSGTSRVTTLPAPMTVPGPDPDARQDERRAADPYVRSDFDGLAVLLTSPQLGVHRVHGREDLPARPEDRVVVSDASSFEAQCLCSVVGDRAATIATRPLPLRR